MNNHDAFLLAESKGFEPLIPFWSIHTFQACSFDRSDNSPYFSPAGWHPAGENLRAANIGFLSQSSARPAKKFPIIPATAAWNGAGPAGTSILPGRLQRSCRGR
jgi:hypothetical protein